MADYLAVIADQARKILKLELENKELKVKVKDQDPRNILMLEMMNIELEEKVKNLECTASTLQELLDSALNINFCDDGREELEVIAMVRPWLPEMNSQPCVGTSAECLPVLAPVASNVPAAVLPAIPSTSGANQISPSSIVVGTSISSVPVTSLEGSTVNWHSISEIPPSKRSKALYKASKCGNLDLVVQLLRNGVNVNYKYKGSSGLHEAAAWNYSDIVSALINYGAHINLRNRHGDTPLHMAAISGHDISVQMLVKAGAQVNVRRSDGNTPLHLATLIGAYNCVCFLLDAGADAGLVNNMGKFPEDLAHMARMRFLLRT